MASLGYVVRPCFKKQKQRQNKLKQARHPVAHICNPSYSEGKDQEDLGLKPAQANSL
jgi:hypothetical protein